MVMGPAFVATLLASS